jgi:hypothetical protein
MSNILPVAISLVSRGWEGFDVSGEIRKLLGARKTVTVGEVLHSNIPAPIVPKVDQLLHQNPKMLARDGRNGSI